VKLLRVLVVGTGTEIGKTPVTTCLLSYARAQGWRVRAYKPIATGIKHMAATWWVRRQGSSSIVRHRTSVSTASSMRSGEVESGGKR
jgi:dethiobiotin synthetase